MPFPAYRFLPGHNPHPNRDPQGHNYGKPEPHPSHSPPDQWKTNEWYLFGIDLYNFAYWWECHVALEGLWHAAGRINTQAQFYQGIIQVSASNLKRYLGRPDVARDLALEGLERLRPLEHEVYMGLDVGRFISDFHACLNGAPAPLIRLHL